MPRKYFYRGKFGLWNVEKQDGLTFSDISDVSSDSDVPSPRQWRPPSPGAQARRLDADTRLVQHSDDYETKRTDLERITSLAIRSVRWVRARVRRHQRRTNRRPNKEEGLWTPESSPRPRERSPDSMIEAQDSDAPLTEQEQLELSSEIARKVQAKYALHAWRKRHSSRQLRRAKRDQRVQDRIQAWLQRSSKTRFTRAKKANTPIRDRKPQVCEEDIWSRKSGQEAHDSQQATWNQRYNLLFLNLSGPDGAIDEAFLGSVSVQDFYEIYLTFPPVVLETFNASTAGRYWPRPRKDRGYEEHEPESWIMRDKVRKARTQQSMNNGIMNGRIEKTQGRASSDRTRNKSLGDSVLAQMSLRGHFQRADSPNRPRMDSPAAKLRSGIATLSPHIAPKLRIKDISNDEWIQMIKDELSKLGHDVKPCNV